MGRIKSTMVKKTAKILLGKEPAFSEDFENNKKILGNTMPSKPIKNKIAGYLARLKRMQKAPQKIKQTQEPNIAVSSSY